MKRYGLEPLLQLREKRKEQALELVALRNAALLQAERQLADAQLAVQSHLNAVREHENSSLSEVMGKMLSHADILNIRSELTILVYKLDELLALEQNAARQRDAAQSGLEAATDIYRQHYRSAEKLQHLVTQENRKHQRKELALSEASEDEVRNRGSRPSR